MTDKQLRFINEYSRDCNATQAAIRAGYSPKTAYSIGQELLKKPEIQRAMQTQLDSLIADKEERLIFWSDIMRDADQDMKHRLKASELLGKAQADFTEKAEIKNEVKISDDYNLSALSKEELLSLRELLVKASK